VIALQFMPQLLLSMVGGVLADRVSKRWLMAITHVAMAGQAATIWALAASERIELWHLYILALVLGTASAIADPTRQSMAMELVGPADLPNAVALNSTAFNLCRIIGPAIAGVLIQAFGLSGCFLINALFYLPLIAAMPALRTAELFDLQPPSAGPLWRQLGECLSYAFRTRAVALMLVQMFVQGTFGQNFQSYVPLLARYSLDAGALGLGALFGFVGIGSILMGLVLASRREATERAMRIGAASFAVVLWLTALSQWFPLTALLLVGLGAASILFSATVSTRLQFLAPPTMRGRLVSLQFTLSAGMSPFGAMFIGFVSERFGVPQALTANAAICALGLAAVMLFDRLRPAQPAAASCARIRAES
jgi:MFS family permease